MAATTPTVVVAALLGGNTCRLAVNENSKALSLFTPFLGNILIKEDCTPPSPPEDTQQTTKDLTIHSITITTGGFYRKSYYVVLCT